VPPWKPPHLSLRKVSQSRFRLLLNNPGSPFDLQASSATKTSSVRSPMRLPGASTLRSTLLLWFMGGFTFTSPAYSSRHLTPVRRAIHAVTRGVVVGEVSRAVAGREGQRRADQGSASDGVGSDFDVPAVLRLSFGLVVGLYLTLGGMRMWRVTTGLAIGLVFAFCGQSSSRHPSCSKQPG